MSSLNEAERRFAKYLDSHGYTWSHEPDYQVELELSAPVSTTPDFLVTRGGRRGVFEARQFETTAIRDRLAGYGGYAALSAKEVYGALRLALIEKAEQLRPLAGAGVPLVITLANPLRADVTLDAHHVTAAMFGNPSVLISIDTATGGPVEGEEPVLNLQDYGAFRSPVDKDGERVFINRHEHVSSVAVVHERLHSMNWREEIIRSSPAVDASIDSAIAAAFPAMQEIQEAVDAGQEPQGAYQWVELYELDGEDAVAVPSDWFDGPRDRRYGFDEGRAYGLLPSYACSSSSTTPPEE